MVHCISPQVITFVHYIFTTLSVSKNLFCSLLSSCATMREVSFLSYTKATPQRMLVESPLLTGVNFDLWNCPNHHWSLNNFPAHWGFVTNYSRDACSFSNFNIVSSSYPFSCASCAKHLIYGYFPSGIKNSGSWCLYRSITGTSFFWVFTSLFPFIKEEYRTVSPIH